jgi:hypothetical protein
MLKTNQILQENAQQRTETQRDNSQNRDNSPRESAPQRTDSQSNSQSRTSSRESAPERTQNQEEILKTELTLLEKVLRKNSKSKRKFSKSVQAESDQIILPEETIEDLKIN